MIRCGVIGFGKMGRIRAAALQASSRARVSAIFDPHPGASIDPALRVSSPDALLASDDIDAVFVCTPTHMNKPLTIAGLSAGKHVFCEKPPAFTAADVEDIRREESRAGRVLAYGFNHRHHESVRLAKQLLQEGALGRLLWMRGRYGKSVEPDFFEGWRADRSRAGGGILLDQGIHMLDLFLYLAEDFDEVQAIVSNSFWKLDGIEDNVFAQFRNARTGVTASLHSTMTQWRHLFSLEIFLSRGHVVLNGLRTSSGAYGPEVLTIARNRAEPPVVDWGPDEVFTYDTDTSWRSEVDEFIDAIEFRRPVRMGSSDDAFKVMRLIDRIYQSR